MFFFFFSSRRRHTRYWRDWSSDVCSSDLWDRLHHGPDFSPWDASRGDRRSADRKSVVWGKSVDLGGRRIIKKKKIEKKSVIIGVGNTLRRDGGDQLKGGVV